MLLHQARSSETRRWTGRRVYVFYAALDCNPDEKRIVTSHGLQAIRVYTAPVAYELHQRAQAADERAHKLSPWKRRQVAGVFLESSRSLALAVRSRLAFHITVGDLLAGAVVRSTDLAEIREAEIAINEAFLRLDAAVQQARRFETGDENLLTPLDDDAPAHPNAWPRHWRT